MVDSRDLSDVVLLVVGVLVSLIRASFASADIIPRRIRNPKFALSNVVRDSSSVSLCLRSDSSFGWFWCFLASLFSILGSTSGHISSFDCVVTVAILAIASVYFLFSCEDYNEVESTTSRKPRIEVDTLVLIAVIGCIVLVRARDFLEFFFGLEVLSISLYVLVGLARKERASSEAALKYFVLGSFSSAFLLYGIALLYLTTNSLSLNILSLSNFGSHSVEHLPTCFPIFWLGVIFVLFGLLFKLGVFPFHIWVPDVYQGAPTSTTLFMSSIVKIAIISLLIKFLYALSNSFILDFRFGVTARSAFDGILWAMGIGTVLIGNLAALQQTSIKRLLAYSGIANAGNLLLGCSGMVFNGIEFSARIGAIIFYVLFYGVAVLLAFSLVFFVTRGGKRVHDIDSVDALRGLACAHPFWGIAFSVSLFSLAGLPPFAGFVGKFYLFMELIKYDHVGTAVFLSLSSIVSIYYYLKLVSELYAFEASSSGISFDISHSETAVVFCLFLLLTFVGIFPNTMVQLLSSLFFLKN